MSTRSKVLLIIISLLLCTWSIVGPNPMAALSPFAESQPKALQVVLGLVVLPFWLCFNFGFMIGTALLGFLIWLRFGRASVNRSWFQPVVLPVLCVLCEAIQAAPYLRVPAGASIRPMGYFLCALISGLAFTCLSVASVIVYWSKVRRNYGMCTVALVLGLMALPVGLLSLRAVANIKGFIID